MKKSPWRLALATTILMSTAAPAQALVMDFGSGPGSTTALDTPFTQAGMSMTPLDTGNSRIFNHWDLLKDSAGATNEDWAAAVHMGNNAEEVEFTFGGAAFDLLSFDIEGIFIDADYPSYTLLGTFTSSSGAIFTSSSVGSIDFSILSGFQNITSFKLSMPVGVTTDCDIVGANCSTMVFDNIRFQEASVIPIPAAVWLFASGLFAFIAAARKNTLV